MKAWLMKTLGLKPKAPSLKTIMVTQESLETLLVHAKEKGAELALRDVASRKGRLNAALPNGISSYQDYAKHLVELHTRPT